MNLEELSKSMRELESELASYEHGNILFRHDIRNYSTPGTEQMSGVSTSRSPRETGYERDRALAQQRATSPPILTREGATRAQMTPIDSSYGVRKKSVKLEDARLREKGVLTNEKYSLSKYLIKDKPIASSLQSYRGEPNEKREPWQDKQPNLRDCVPDVTSSRRVDDASTGAPGNETKSVGSADNSENATTTEPENWLKRMDDIQKSMSSRERNQRAQNRVCTTSAEEGASTERSGKKEHKMLFLWSHGTLWTGLSF